MTLAHMSLDQLGGALSTRALLHFVRRLPATSALARDLDPACARMAPWLDGSLAAPLLADLVDATNWARWEYLATRPRRKGRRARIPKPRPVRRPWGDPRAKRLGKGPIAASRFEEWWGRKGR